MVWGFGLLVEGRGEICTGDRRRERLQRVLGHVPTGDTVY